MPTRFALFVCLVLSPLGARAAGLIADPADTPDGGPSRALLLSLDRLDVRLGLTEAGASVTESRAYEALGAASYTGGGTVHYFRSVPMGTTVTSVRINGAAVGGTVLDASEADVVRRNLTLRLHDPAPLREYGQALWVGDPVPVSADRLWHPIEVEVAITEPLAPHGTLRGVALPVDWHKAPVDSVNVEVTATTDGMLRTLYAPYHPLVLEREGEHTLRGSYAGYQRCTAFDVIVLLSVGDEPFKLDLIPHRNPNAEHGNYMALLSSLSSAGEGDALPRDLVIVVDRSGSMGGEKILQAAAALRGILDGLRPDDRFALVSFAGDVTPFKDSAELAADPAVSEAHAFVDAIVADGGTNIFDALDMGFDTLPTDLGRPRYVVFLTDGQATAGNTDTEAILERVRLRNEVGARVFPFGIGDDVNTVLLDRLANESNGAAFYVRPGQPVDEAVATFFAGISDPLLVDPVLDMRDFGGSLPFPQTLGDLFAGQTTVVLGRYDAPGEGQVVLSGTRGGEPVAYVYEVSLPEVCTRESYVARIWATRRVGALLEEVKLGDADPGLVAEALALANRYGVVTEFTYFTLEENGDTVMTYSPVPVDVVGSVAVSTSASLDSYQKGGTVDAPADTWLRYVLDRTFPSLGGWFTDTAMALDVAPTELTFGSKRYFEALQQEASTGGGGFFAVAPNVRFELLGRSFRVTDAEGHPTGQLPAESPTLPAAVAPPEELGVSAVYRPTESPGPDYVPPAGQRVPPTRQPDTGTDGPRTANGTASGCTAGGGTGASPVGLLFVIVLLAWRSRRSQA